MKPPPTYNAHETQRMKAVHGLPLASFWARGGAFLTDVFLAILASVPVVLLLVPILTKLGYVTGDVNLTFSFKNWYSVVLTVVYFSLTTYWGKGKTPGKWMFGIRVVSLVHKRLSFWHCIERALGYAASSLEFGFGFIQYFIHPNRRTVHDRIAETIVVRDRARRKSSVGKETQSEHSRPAS